MDINFFGVTNFRNVRRRFGIKQDDRRRHFYAIGKTGMGKTEMLKNMAVQDIQEGNGIGFVDPHGEASEEIIHFVPQDRVPDTVYFNPADTEYPIAFNVMESVHPEYRHLVASGLMSVFKKVWPDVWSARMEYILNNTVLALLEYPGATLLGINRMLVDVDYRKKVIDKITDPVVKAFWVQEYARYTQRYEVEATAAIQNKVGQFVSNPLIRNIVGQVKSSINMREVMDGEKVLIVNLSKGRIGEDNSRLLGAMLITKLQLAAMSRVDMPEEQRKDFFLYIDEFQNFASESFVNILSEARKYRLSLILSHQYVAQLDETVRDAVFGNVGTMVSFRIGAEDAEYLEKEFTPEFLATDFVNLGKYSIYVKLMIDGLAGRPFSAETLPPPQVPEQTFANDIIAHTRDRYAMLRNIVEERIAKWAEVDMETMQKNPLPIQGLGAPQQEQVLYEAKCDQCGKDTKVVFPPDGKRKVYCKSCRKKLKRQREQGIQNQSGGESPRKGNREVSLSQALQKGPTYFHQNRNQKSASSPAKAPQKAGLREVLSQVLSQKGSSGKEGQKNQKGEPRTTTSSVRGKLRPGETVRFKP